MAKKLTWLIWAVILGAIAIGVAAEDRLPVLEFFGRPTGAFCSAAGPAMRSLQEEMQGRALLLEYDFDAFYTSRIQRFLAANPTAPYLPFVMVGSGNLTSSGPVVYESVYRTMIKTELARAPEAAVEAFWIRSGDTIRVFVRAKNLRASSLVPGDNAAVWVVVWEDTRVGVSSTWVRAVASANVPLPLASGDWAALTLNTATLSGVDWTRLGILALLDHRPGNTGKYNMLQAAIAQPTALLATPTELSLGASAPNATVGLTGPHVLTWTATPDVTWLQVTPSSGGLPETMTVTLTQTPTKEQTGTVRIDATGEGLFFSTTITVTALGPVRLVRRRLGRVPGTP